MALAKCFERARWGEVDREEETPAATELRRDSTRVNLDTRRADSFGAGLDPFLDPFEEPAFVGFAFKWTDFVAADARPAAFLVGFDLGFAFVAIKAAYTGYAN